LCISPHRRKRSSKRRGVEPNSNNEVPLKDYKTPLPSFTKEHTIDVSPSNNGRSRKKLKEKRKRKNK